MPKAPKSAKLNRIARRLASAAPIPENETKKTDDTLGIRESQTLSRGQRKRLAKREQYLRREKMVLSSLNLYSQEEQKKRIDGLFAIKEALMTTTKSETSCTPSTNEHQKLYNTNKSKKALISPELQRMSLVMQHPSFKANPFETMQEHLRNSLGGNREKMEQKAKQRAMKEKNEAEEAVRQKKERLQGIKKKSKKKFKCRTWS